MCLATSLSDYVLKLVLTRNACNTNDRSNGSNDGDDHPELEWLLRTPDPEPKGDYTLPNGGGGHAVAKCCNDEAHERQQCILQERADKEWPVAAVGQSAS